MNVELVGGGSTHSLVHRHLRFSVQAADDQERLRKAGLDPVQTPDEYEAAWDEAIEVARTCRTIMGANGITLEYPVLRHANNLESVLTYEGTAEVHQLVIGQALTGSNAFR